MEWSEFAIVMTRKIYCICKLNNWLVGVRITALTMFFLPLRCWRSHGRADSVSRALPITGGVRACVW